MERRSGDQPADLPTPDLVLFVLRHAAATVAHDLQERLAGDGIRPSAYAALALLQRRPGLRQSQLSVALSMRRTNLVPLLAELVERGLCERRVIQSDRRAVALSLTPEGEAVLRRCEAECRLHEARFSGRLGPDGRAHLLSLLHRLTDDAFDPPA